MPPIFHFDIFIFGFLCRCVLSPAGWAPTQSMPRWPRSVGLAGWFSNLNEDKLNIFCKGWRREKSWGRERFLRKCRRERESCWKTAVHKYTPAYRCLILCLKTTDKKIAIEFVDSSTYLKLALLSTSVFQLVLEFPPPSLPSALSTGATVSPSIRSDQQLYNMHSK